MHRRRARLALPFAIALLAIDAPMARGQGSAAPAPPAAPSATPAPSLADGLFTRLSPDWRLIALKYDAFAHGGDWLRTASDNVLRGFVLDALASTTGAEDFVLDHLGDPMPVTMHRRLVNTIGYGEAWLTNARASAALARDAETEPDPAAAQAALGALRVLEARRVRVAVERRLQGVTWDYAHHRGEVDSLEAVDEQLGYEIADVELPAFLLRPPPVIRTAITGGHLRVLAFGDFGEPGDAETKTAEAMRSYHRAHPFDLAVTVGDNFYFSMDSITDARWQSVWEALYGRLGIPVYPTFGNHDWGGAMSAAELLYSTRSPDWRFPAPYYTFVAGPVQFFAINTEYDDQPSAAQRRWLQSALDSSHARWKVVYGHFPVYSSAGMDARMATALMPILAGRADVYLCGHLHTMQHHMPEDGVNLFIVGGGGAHLHQVVPNDPETIYAQSTHGFGVLEADDQHFTVRFIGDDGSTLHEATLRK